MREGLNLSKKSLRPRLESPLDLSAVVMSPMAPVKAPKIDPADGMAAWATAGAFPFLNPFLTPGTAGGTTADAAKLAAAITPPTSSSATTLQDMLSIGRSTNPLDQMSEFAKAGLSSRASIAGQRHSAWQSQWINRGPENTKDIFKCVWCKDSFSSLQALTIHMKETKHFGGNIPPSPQMPIRSPLVSPTAATPSSRAEGAVHSPSITPPSQTSSSNFASQSPNSKPARDILKEQLPMPRKLVRGQDVWLGRGEQQTKDILKCMWCGQSFRSLADLTTHMSETKHYTKVIPQVRTTTYRGVLAL